MQTIKLQYGPKGDEATIHYNKDWAGEAIVFYTNSQLQRVQTVLPGALLVAVGGLAARDRIKDHVVDAIARWRP